VIIYAVFAGLLRWNSKTFNFYNLTHHDLASKLRQQKLPAWQPILTAYTAIPVVFIIGFVFIPIGVFALLSAKSGK
jgi:hypothetical protein